MSIVKRTTVHSLCCPSFGVVNFELDRDDPSNRYANVWFEACHDRKECHTWNGLTLNDKKQNMFLTGVARQIWNDLVQRGFEPNPIVVVKSVTEYA